MVKFCRVDNEFTHPEHVMLEICFHEALCRHRNIVGYYGTYQTSPIHFGLVLESFDMSLGATTKKIPSPSLCLPHV